MKEEKRNLPASQKACVRWRHASEAPRSLFGASHELTSRTVLMRGMPQRGGIVGR